MKKLYPLLKPRDRKKEYNSIMIEFKYLKKEEAGELEEEQKKARKQIEEYSEIEEIKDIEKLYKYTVVAVVDEIYVEEYKGNKWITL